MGTDEGPPSYLFMVASQRAAAKADFRMILGALQGVERRLGARIGGIKKGLNARIDSVEKKLGARISGLENRLDSQINGLESRLDPRINGLESRLDSRINGLAVELVRGRDQMMKMEERLIRRMDDGFSRITKILDDHAGKLGDLGRRQVVTSYRVDKLEKHVGLS